jgi:hypothetical protein
MLTAAALLCAPVFAAPTDTLMVRKSHTDAYSAGPKEVPAKDETQTIWIAKDRVRVDTEDNSILLRLDEKKMYLIDPKDKSYQVIDLPLDLKKYLPENMQEMYEKMKAATTVSCTVKPTDETKKIKDWNTKKYEVTISGGMVGSTTEEVWTTKDIPIDATAFLEMTRMRSTMMPGGETIVDELKKLDGIPVMSERTRKAGSASVKTHEELVSIEQKDAPAGEFDVPKDYTAKPFDPMSGAPMGGRGRPGGKGGEGKPPPKQQ